MVRGVAGQPAGAQARSAAIPVLRAWHAACNTGSQSKHSAKEQTMRAAGTSFVLGMFVLAWSHEVLAPGSRATRS